MKKIFILIMLIGSLLFAQNTDKATSNKTSQQMDYNSYQTTLEGYRSILVGGNAIDAGNSTTTNLGAAKTFTGTAKDLSGITVGTISVNAYASHISGVGLFKVQGSPNNTAWFTIDSTTVLPAKWTSITVAPKFRYYRVTYTNGADSVTSFVIQSILQTNSGSVTTTPAIPAQDSVAKFLIQGDTTLIYNPGGRYQLTRIFFSDSSGNSVTDSFAVYGVRGGTYYKIPCVNRNTGGIETTLVPGDGQAVWYTLYPAMFYIKWIKIVRLNVATIARSTYVEVRSIQ